MLFSSPPSSLGTNFLDHAPFLASPPLPGSLSLPDSCFLNTPRTLESLCQGLLPGGPTMTSGFLRRCQALFAGVSLRHCPSHTPSLLPNRMAFSCRLWLLILMQNSFWSIKPTDNRNPAKCRERVGFLLRCVWEQFSRGCLRMPTHHLCELSSPKGVGVAAMRAGHRVGEMVGPGLWLCCPFLRSL